MPKDDDGGISSRERGTGRSTAFASLVDYGSIALVQLLTLAFTAHLANVAEFGQFTVAALVVSLGIQAFNGVVGTWILTSPPTLSRMASSVSLGGCILAALIFTAVAILPLAGLTFVNGLDAVLLVTTVIALVGRLPGEGLRTIEHRTGDPWRSAWFAVTTLCLFGLGIGLWSITGRAGGWLAPSIIQATTFLVAGVGLAIARRARPTLKSYRELVAVTGGRWVGLGVVFGASLAIQLLVPAAILAAASYAEVGVFRGAQYVIGIPLQVTLALTPMLSAGLARRYYAHGVLRPKDFVTWLGLLGAIAVPASIVLKFLPDPLGEILLADIWKPVQGIILWIAAGLLLDQATIALATYFRVVRRLTPIAILRSVEVLLVLPAAYFATRWNGVEGAAMMLAIIAFGFLLITLFLMLRDSRNREAPKLTRDGAALP